MEAPCFSMLHVRLTASLRGDGCTRSPSLRFSVWRVKTFFGAGKSQWLVAPSRFYGFKLKVFIFVL